MISAITNAEFLTTNVWTFSSSYSVYFSFVSPGRNVIGLDFYQDQDIACPQYEFSCPVANKYVLVLNNRIANTWNTEERPLGFPFFPNEQTSIIVTPLETAYYIEAQAADTTFTYEFSYRNEHKPHQVTRIQGYYISNACLSTSCSTCIICPA